MNYILFEDETEPGTMMLGFNKYNEPGFIDDGYGWSDEERENFEEVVLGALASHVYGMESYTFTYQIHNISGLEETLANLGITKQEPGWIEKVET